MTQTGARVKFLDPNHPMFRRPVTRWLTALLPLAWGAVEFVLGNPGWGVLFVAAGGYAFWILIVKGPDQPS
jgi:hypothetical protein